MKKENKDILQITQIKINLPDKEIELTSEEARKVYEELDKLFKEEHKSPDIDKCLEKMRIKEYIPYPIYIDRWTPPSRPYWEPIVTCLGNSNDLGAINTHLLIDLTNNS